MVEQDIGRHFDFEEAAAASRAWPKPAKATSPACCARSTIRSAKSPPRCCRWRGRGRRHARRRRLRGAAPRRARAGRAAGRAHPEGNDGAAAPARRPARRRARPHPGLRLRRRPDRRGRSIHGSHLPWKRRRSAPLAPPTSAASSRSTPRSKDDRGAATSSGACRRRAREPALHAQFAAVDERGIAGYLLARVLEGEFGARRERACASRSSASAPTVRGHGIGSRLFDALANWSGRHAIGAMRTQASWRDHRMLGWLDLRGFALAPAQVLECVDRHRDVEPGAR